MVRAIKEPIKLWTGSEFFFFLLSTLQPGACSWNSLGSQFVVIFPSNSFILYGAPNN